jgi:hypothetical protein
MIRYVYAPAAVGLLFVEPTSIASALVFVTLFVLVALAADAWVARSRRARAGRRGEG